ncbi:peptidoglycan DD-metalloendopeptidase family protein [Nostoc sp.]
MMNKYQLKIGAKLKSIAFPAVILMCSAVATPAMAADWSFPWQAGKSATISRGTGSHNDGWNTQSNAVDFAISPGTPVLAPVDSTIVKVCQARGADNHNAILFSSPDGNYTLMHLKAFGLYTGQFFKKGQQIGVVAADTPNDPKCAISTGPHLHINFPSRNLVVDGYQVATMTRGTYTSRNGTVSDDLTHVNFSGVTAPAGVNVRSGTSTSASIVGRLGGTVRVNFDGWKYGDSVADTWTGKPDRRWYRIAGTNNWIASAVVNGNAPGSQP